MAFDSASPVYDLEKRTLVSLLKRSADIYALNPALGTIETQPINYAALLRKTARISEMLKKEGVLKGDRVAILGENSPNWGIAFFAVTSIGAVVVPILPDFNPVEIQHIIRHAEVKAVFVSERLFEKLDGHATNSITTILLNTLQLLPQNTRRENLKDIIEEGSRELTKIKAAALRMTGLATSEVKEDDLASIIYTSGTTGHSKGVMLTHKNLIFDAQATLKIQDVNSQDRLLSILPLSHTYENTLGFILPMMQGACVYYSDKPPTPTVLAAAMKKIQPTLMLSVPLVIEKMVKLRILPKFTKGAIIRYLYKIGFIRKKLHQLAGKKLIEAFGGQIHFFGVGGAGLAPEIEKFLREAKFPYAIGYGLTETAPLVAGCGPDRTRFRSTGPPLPGMEVKLNNPDSKTGEGEIWVRGDNVMQGYYRDPERTAEVLTKDGWFKTGDLGLFDADGYLYIKGRIKNMILGPSGENIFPEEIESKINECEYVLESLVFEQDSKLAARVHLDYERLDNESRLNKWTDSQITERIKILLNEIRQCTNGKIATFSRIHTVIEQTEPFEKTPTKKIKRFLYTQGVA